MYENGNIPEIIIQNQTRLFDPESNRTVALLQGQVLLPVGAEIELYDEVKSSHGTAIVRKVRLLNGTASHPNELCLDVAVDARWWDAHPMDA